MSRLPPQGSAGVFRSLIVDQLRNQREQAPDRACKQSKRDVVAAKRHQVCDREKAADVEGHADHDGARVALQLVDHAMRLQCNSWLTHR